MKYPTIWQMPELFKHLCGGDSVGIEIKPGVVHWFPARPLGVASVQQRFRAAWRVFTGRADAVEWPFQ